MSNIRKAASDGLGPIEAEDRRALEVQAPTVVQRQPVKEPMQTGIKAIDAMTAIGRGQRQLIIGDLGSGKTSLALDTVMAQAGQGVKCVYVMIGQKRSEAALAIACCAVTGRWPTPRWSWGKPPRHAGRELSRPLCRLRHCRGLDAPRRGHLGGV